MENESPLASQAPHRIGQDLADLSIEELNARIRLLEDEIERLRRAIETKQQSLAAASAVFER